MAKVLVVGLGEVVGQLVSPNQYTFLIGRMLVNILMVVNEVIHLAKISEKPSLIFKVNFEKAYDL